MLATVVAFLPVLAAGFVNYDDDRVILHNPYLHQPFAAASSWMWTTTFIGHYQPLTWLTLWVDGRLGGFRPPIFHIGSLIFHVATAVLVALTLARLLRIAPATRQASAATIRVASAAAALFWAIHPLRVESVAWISERRDPLSTLFWVAALYGYLRYATGSLGPLRRGWYLMSCAALGCSLLAKAWGMSFVVILIALDWAVLDRRAWIEKLPYAAMGATAAVVAWFAQHGAPDTMVTLSQWGWPARTLQACYGLCFYVVKTIVPARLAVLYEIPRSWHDMLPIFMLSACAVIVGAIVILLIARRHRGVAAASVVYGATLAPVLGLAQSGPQLVADRYAYVSGLAITALVGAALVILARRAGLRQIAAASAAVLLAYGVLTYRQAGVWHDSLTLWQHAVDAGQAGYRAHFDLGQALRAGGRLDAAIAEYQAALDVRPDSGNAWYVYGNAMKAAGRAGDAEAAYKRATTIADPASPEWMLAHVNLGNQYFNEHRVDDAIGEYRAAISQFAGRPAAEVPPEPYLYLGMALGDKGDLVGAREALGIALRYPTTHARAMAELRRIAEVERNRR